MTNKKESRYLRVNLFISKYLLYIFPVIIGTVIWGVAVDFDDTQITNSVMQVIWEISGLHIMIWFVLVIYFLLTLLVSTEFREIVMSKITRSEEKDERDTYISGRASKATFFLTLTVMIVLLFVTGIQFNMYNPSKEERLDGKKGTITIGYRLKFFEGDKSQKVTEVDKKGTLIDLKGIPLSKEALILIMILFHVGGYHIFTRKRFKV